MRASLALAGVVLACGATGEVGGNVGRRHHDVEEQGGEAGVAAAAGAGAEGGGEGGSGGLNCDDVDLSDIDTVHYVVSDDGETLLEGDISIADPAATITVLVGGLPPGDHDITFTAGVLEQCGITCEGLASFEADDVLDTAVGVRLQCREPDDDGVLIHTGKNPSCELDVLRFYTAMPMVQNVDGTILLTAGADPIGGVAPSYHWTATGGALSNADEPNATFDCAGARGTHSIGLTVSGEFSSVYCEQSVSFTVKCDELCGNGLIDAGEDCDPDDPATAAGCPSDCTMPVCGDQVVESPETCEPPGAAGCDAQCQGSSSACGNGVVEAGEECEPPGTASCDIQCAVL